MKKSIVLALFTAVIFSSYSKLNGAELQLRATPAVVLPVQNNFTPEFAIFGQLDMALFNLLTIGVEGSYATEKPTGMSNNINFMAGGAGIGAYFYPLPRMYVAGGGAFGAYSWNTIINSTTKSASDLYWRGYGEIGFRINPTFTVSGVGGYTQYMVSGKEPFVSGAFAGLSVKMNFSTGKKGKGNVVINLSQESAVYPLFQQVYRTSPVGTVTLTNGESAEIRNVTVSFRAGKYTASALKSEKINVIKKMGTYEVPLMVDFSSDLLKFSEDGKMSGEIVVDYELLGNKKQSVQSVSLTVQNRNSYLWGNNESLAAFVSPETPEILEYAKTVAGVARNNFTLYTGMNRNLQFAAAMAEAFTITGIKYSADKITPYSEYHSSTKNDYIQYPVQTYDYGTGDYDDLALFFASCLESVNVETALLPLQDDFIVLVSLGIKPTQALNHFASEDSLVITDTDVFFPLSMAHISEGFTKARDYGNKAVEKCNADVDGDYELILVHYAWETYPPAVYTGVAVDSEKPANNILEKQIKAAIQEYIRTDLEKVIARARASGDLNKLGMALVRSGRYSEAKAEFNKAAANGSVSAMNNIANILVVEKDYAGAVAQYKKVLQKDPGNVTAQKGLESTSAKLTN